MSDSLSAALTLVQGAFADVAQGMSVQDGGADCSAGSIDAAVVGGASIAALADLVAAAQSVVNAASAVQMVALARLAARETVWAGAVELEVDRGVGFIDEFASTLVGPLLGLSPGSADARLDTAATIASKLPTTLATMAEGGLDPWRARCVAEELREATAETCALVEARVFPPGLGDTPRALTARVRRALALVDADAVRVKRPRPGWTGSSGWAPRPLRG